MVAGMKSTSSGRQSAAKLAHAEERVEFRNRKHLDFLIELLDKLVPVFQTDLEDLTIVDLRDLDEIKVALDQVVFVVECFDELREVNKHR
jgi:hypothetical protein